MTKKNRRNRLGILTNNIGQNESFVYLIKDMDAALRHTSIFVFQENPAPPIDVIPCPILSFSELWCFGGAAIATTLSLASKLLEVPGLTDRYYLVNELEWIGPQPAPADLIISIFSNPKLRLITHSDLYKSVIRNNFNREDVLVLNKLHLLDELTTYLNTNKSA